MEEEKYYYLTVKYVDIPSDSEYNYISDYEDVVRGDFILVDRAGIEALALVTDAKYYTKDTAPYPPEKTKHIIKKLSTQEDFEEFGIHVTPVKEELSYFRITTLSKNKETIAKISVKLIQSKMAASTHTDKVLSSYWWKGKVVDEDEYRLEIITREDKVDEIVNVIKENHDYEVPEIQLEPHFTLNEDIEKWIDDILDGKEEL